MLGRPRGGKTMIKAKLLLALVIALRAVGAACAADDRSILTREIIC